MSRRISIDITDAQHAKLEALAALKGQSIEDFVLSRTLGEEAMAIIELEALLDDRLSNARAGGISSRTVADIIDQVRDETLRHDPNG